MSPVHSAALLWRLPLAIASFLFKRACAVVLRAILLIGSGLSRQRFDHWRITTQATVRTPLFVPLVMTTGPRWNAHALTANVGPLRIARNLGVDVAGLNRAAAIWSLTAYSVPDFRERLFLSSADSAGDAPELALKQGRYLIGVRMYELHPAPAMPQLVIDGDLLIPAQAIPADANDFLCTLVRRRPRWYYTWLQYYVHVMLRHSRTPWPIWVRREFLPVGNVGTRFEFGLLAPGKTLAIAADRFGIEDCKLYVTVYDKRSFPIAWRTLRSDAEVLPALSTSAYFVVRCQAIGKGDPALAEIAVKAGIDRSDASWDTCCE